MGFNILRSAYSFDIPMKILFFLMFFHLYTTNTSAVANTPFKAWVATTSWKVYIHNKIKDPITVHVRSKNDDLRNCTLPFNGIRDWSFYANINRRTLFYANLYWKSKTASFNVYDEGDFTKYCSTNKLFMGQKCYCLVRENGFYLSRRLDNPSPPKLHDWS